MTHSAEHTPGPEMLGVLIEAVGQLQFVRDIMTMWGKGDSHPAYVMDKHLEAMRAVIAKATGK